MSTTNPFASSAFTKGLADIQSRANASRTVNSNTSQQRMGLGDTSKTPSVNTYTNNATQNASEAERQGYRNANEALANNPMFRQTQLNDSRNFAEDTRRFNEGLSFKNTADQRANDTDRFRSSTQLEGVKYNADAGVKSTQIGANAQMYGADRQLDGVRLQTDASRYGADRGYQASIYNADRGVDQARIGADANRFSALLGAGTATLNSQQYRPSFNR